jgi:hypothetical protein
MKSKPNNISQDNYLPYSLHNINNYKKNMTNDISDILNKYVLLIIDYMNLISEKIYIKQSNYYKFIFIRGLDTITSVFKILLFFTKNLDVTYYHSQKAFYFYIEFIEQISNDQNTFLNLSSREACMFVYKKTLFEINNDIKKNINENNEEEKKNLYFIDNHQNIYKNIVYFCIQQSELDYHNRVTYIHDFCDKIKQFSEYFNHVILPKVKIDCIYLFINHLLEREININCFFELNKLFVTKISDKKTSINYKILHDKILFDEFNEKLKNLAPKTCIMWLFQ